jgi:hypothetical protein
VTFRTLSLVSVMLLTLCVTATSSGEPGGHSPICTRGLTTVEVDPRGLLPLQANSIAPAAVAALRHESRASRPLVVGATLATDDRQRGSEAKFSCGRRVWLRTVVVYIRLRALLPSQSLSQRVDFVGRFPRGYRVWQVVH